MNKLVLVLIIVLAANASSGQVVSVDKKTISGASLQERDKLVSRLSSYIAAFNNGNVDELFDLVSERAKRGMNRDEFLKKVTTEPDEERILQFRIRKIGKATDSNYRDEPKPSPGEGEKWFVTGCAKVQVKGASAKKLIHGFDVWLRDGQWYIRRGGLMLSNGGYTSCKL